MIHIAKSGSFHEHEPLLLICTQLHVFMSALLQAVGIQKGGLQGGHSLWGRQKKGDFYIALLLCYDLDDYMIHHYIPLTIAAHIMSVTNSFCHCSCALRWLFRRLRARLLLVPYLAQFVFWIPLNLYALDLDYSVVEILQNKPTHRWLCCWSVHEDEICDSMY